MPVKKSLCLTLLVVLGTAPRAAAQGYKESFAEFRKGALQRYNSFRDKINADYASFLEQAWKDLRGEAPVRHPVEKEPEPVVIDEKERQTQPEDRPVVIQDVVRPEPPAPQPEPVAPIEPQPQPAPATVRFSFFGTPCSVRFSVRDKFSLADCSERTVADAWKRLAQKAYDNLLCDCLALRTSLRLPDWAYLQLLDSAAVACMGQDDAATLLMAYAYCQSGYQMRLGTAEGRLRMLYGTRHTIYDRCGYTIQGSTFYLYGPDAPRVQLSTASFPQERPLSLSLTTVPALASAQTAQRTLTAEAFKGMSVSVSVNANLLRLYDTYPTSRLGTDVMTRWAFYANTPMAADVSATLYPALSERIAGLSPKEAVERLLNWVQTAFEYEYDDVVWGGDRAFFAEETLHYPYCDCEDRSILLSRLVRDLLGLDCLLVYYPGHLAMAVCFPDAVQGDYISLDGRRYTVCDPTFINAPVGRTMPGMDNAAARVILLD